MKILGEKLWQHSHSNHCEENTRSIEPTWLAHSPFVLVWVWSHSWSLALLGPNIWFSHRRARVTLWLYTRPLHTQSWVSKAPNTDRWRFSLTSVLWFLYFRFHSSAFSTCSPCHIWTYIECSSSLDLVLGCNIWNSACTVLAPSTLLFNFKNWWEKAELSSTDMHRQSRFVLSTYGYNPKHLETTVWFILFQEVQFQILIVAFQLLK